MDNYYQNIETDYEASASSKATNLELVFLDDVVSPVFTKERISGQTGGDGRKQPIRIILVDSNTQEQVTAGPAASAKVKLVLVHKDVGGSTTGDHRDPTHLDFSKRIVVDWKKKKNLLLGDVYLDLKHGSGTVGEIRIKHDRNPIRNVKFRLGAMVVGCRGYNVKEAVTNVFEVKDLRNAPKNKGPLSPTDEVCQLKNIAKKGPIHKRLANANISTVHDFVNMYDSNPQALQEIYGVKGKKWEKTVDHAKTCLFRNTVCNAYGGGGSTSQPSFSMEFDSNDYKPQPLEDEGFIYDSEYSTRDVEFCEVDFGSVEPCQVSGDGVRKDTAKKRWTKLRTILWFPIASFMKKCVGAALRTPLMN